MSPSLHTIMSRLRLRQLRLLIALDEFRSIHRAARHVSITQPGATRALNELEETLGMSLFTRSAQGLTPSEAGRCAIRYARLIENDLGGLCDELAGMQKGVAGRLAVGGVMGAMPMLLDHASQLLARHPTIDLSIIEDTSEGLMRQLDQGRLDMVLCRSSFGQQPEHYRVMGTFQEQLMVVAHPEHALVGVRHPDFALLARAQWIVYPVSMPRILEQEFIEQGCCFVGRTVEISSTFAIISMLRRDRTLLALLPEQIALEQAEAGMLARLDYDLRVHNRPFELVWRRDRALSPVAQYFFDLYKVIVASDADGGLEAPSLSAP